MTTESKPREWELVLQAPEILAILAGRQTQIRIPMQIQPNGHPTFEFKDDPEWGRVAYWPGESEFDPFDCHCPAGNVGDRIWILEDHWRGTGPGFGDHCLIYAADNKPFWMPHSLDHFAFNDDGTVREDQFARRPAVELNRINVRIELEVAAVRIEQLQAMSNSEIIAQGVTEELVHPPSGYDPDNFHPPGVVGYVSGLQSFPSGTIYPMHREAMTELWDHLHPAETWSTNPYVWAVTFERTKPEKAEADGKTTTS